MVCVLRGRMSKFLKYDVFMFLKIDFIVANSADPDEMSHHVYQSTLLPVSRIKRANRFDIKSSFKFIS